MSHDAISTLRNQLLFLGYKPLPTRGKVPALAGWNTADFITRELMDGPKGPVTERIAGWLRRFHDARTTGILIHDGVLAFDIDVDDEAMVEEIFKVLQQIAPDVWARGPTRYSEGTFKCAVFCRVDGELFVRVGSRKYRRPGDPPKAGHGIEVFGGKPFKSGVCSRFFGCYGPRAFDDAGDVVSSYVWAEGVPALHEIALADLPLLAKAQALQMIAAFEILAEAAGWERSTEKDEGEGEGNDVFDIDTATTQFEVMDHGTCSYDDLIGLVGGEDLRCTANFIKGESSDTKDRCRVRWSTRFKLDGYDGCVVVLDGKLAARHYPREFTPAASEDIAAALNELAQMHGGLQFPEDARQIKNLEPNDFYAYLPTHQYIFIATGKLWVMTAINSILPRVIVGYEPSKKKIKDDEVPEMIPITISPSLWLDRNRPVAEMAWAPGYPQLIQNTLLVEGGWVWKDGSHTFNLYRPPVRVQGNPEKAKRWLDLVTLVYPNHVEHIVHYLAHRIQKPHEKINHALVLTGSPGIGKDTILAVLRHGVGAWNFREVSPQDVTGKYNEFVQSVVMRVSEARDLGEINRYAFYESTKTMIAEPPTTVRVHAKYVPHHYVLNVVSVIFTTNYPADGLYLPADDRRHYVCGTEITSTAFAPAFFVEMWDWYANGGLDDVVTYLATYELKNFDAKAPPEKTAAFWRMVDAGMPAETSEFRDALDKAKWPPALTVASLGPHMDSELWKWVAERKNAKNVSRRLDDCGYVSFRNIDAGDGRWAIGKRKFIVYVSKNLDLNARRDAVTTFKEKEESIIGSAAMTKAMSGGTKTDGGEKADEDGKIIPIKPKPQS
jgi:hypothetical protein